MKFAVLAEDRTDAEAITVVIRRHRERCGLKPAKVKVWAGKGCARLRKKAEARIKHYQRKGIHRVVVVHDLDREKETDLRQQLSACAVPSKMSRHICIPREELEAWFWADGQILRKLSRGKVCEGLPEPWRKESPKEALIKLSRNEHRIPRYSTAENGALAEDLDLDLCASRCPEFADLLEFVR